MKKIKTLNMELVFATIEYMIADATARNDQELYYLTRDKVIIYLVHLLGIEPSMLLSLDTKSLREKSTDTDMENYWILDYIMNPDCRAGCLHRSVTKIKDKELVKVIAHYMENIRPYFIKSNDDGALFLSTQQSRLSYAELQTRFAEILTAAGIDNKDLDINDVRFTRFVFGDNSRYETQYVFYRIGSTTTESYCHITHEDVEKYEAEKKRSNKHKEI